MTQKQANKLVEQFVRDAAKTGGVASSSQQRVCSASLVDKLAEAAWDVLNHDNDPHDGQPHNVANWNRLREKLKKVLATHRQGKTPNAAISHIRDEKSKP